MKNAKEYNCKNISNLLLNWYDNNRRNLPWRAFPGEIPNPYYVYLSEIMLHQTTVNTVIPYFLKFIRNEKKFKNIGQLRKQIKIDLLIAKKTK